MSDIYLNSTTTNLHACGLFAASIAVGVAGLVYKGTKLMARGGGKNSSGYRGGCPFSSSVSKEANTGVFREIPPPPATPQLAQFVVGDSNGFLPLEPPMECLPDEFAALESLLSRMTYTQPDGSAGLLRTGSFGPTLLAELPDFSAAVEKVTDSRLATALFRDFSFAASAYLLEPCDVEFRRSKSFGLGRPSLPATIAVPLTILAAKLGAKPYMEYHFSHTLSNYAFVDKNSEQCRQNKPENVNNLRLIRKFDGSEAERGFTLVHVSMVAHSGELVKHVRSLLDSAAAADRESFNEALKGLYKANILINRAMEQMWQRSNSSEYLNFRTYLMGTKNQPMFPDGVIYEGVSTEYQKFCGVTAANDSMIPTLDTVLQLDEEMPDNHLSAMLLEFRAYRPPSHQLFLHDVKTRSRKYNTMGFARADPISSVLFLQILDSIREFRGRHWKFVKEYVIKHTEHAVGTGGTPVVSFLLNQLATILELIVSIGQQIDRTVLPPEYSAQLKAILHHAEVQETQLKREQAYLKSRFPNK